MKNPLPSALLALLLGFCPGALAQQQSQPPTAAVPTPRSAGSPAAAPAAPTAPAPTAPPAAPPPAASATPPSSAARIAPHKWDVESVRCADLLRASDDDRASAAMFYYGYLAAKAGIHVIDTSRVSGNIAEVMRVCEARPRLTVPQAFRDALGRHRAR